MSDFDGAILKALEDLILARMIGADQGRAAPMLKQAIFHARLAIEECEKKNRVGPAVSEPVTDHPAVGYMRP